MNKKEFKARVKYSNNNVDMNRLYDIIVGIILESEGGDEHEKYYTDAC